MQGLCLLIKVELSNDLAFLLSHLLLSTLVHFMLFFLIMMMYMLASCAVLVFWRASILGCVLMLVRRRAEAHLFGRFLLAVSRTTRALCGFLVTFRGLTFVGVLICAHLDTSLSIDYALGAYLISIFLSLQVLISRPFYLHSIKDFHRDH